VLCTAHAAGPQGFENPLVKIEKLRPNAEAGVG
jgi:hypothetical protein